MKPILSASPLVPALILAATLALISSAHADSRGARQGHPRPQQVLEAHATVTLP